LADGVDRSDLLRHLPLARGLDLPALEGGRFQLFNLEFWGYFLAVVVLAIGSATISYFVVEKPALRLKNSIAWWRRPSRTAASGVPEV